MSRHRVPRPHGEIIRGGFKDVKARVVHVVVMNNRTERLNVQVFEDPEVRRVQIRTVTSPMVRKLHVITIVRLTTSAMVSRREGISTFV